MTTYPYLDSAQPIDARVEDLLARMTIDEKIAQMHALWLFLSEEGRHEIRTDQFTGAGGSDTVERMLEHGLGQITRPLGTASVDPRAGVRALNRLQKFLVEQTRLGIPVLSHEECLTGLMARDATLFPSALAFGASWDPELIERVGVAIGDESVSIGAHQGLAPVLDVIRDARWGRTEEAFSEDPWLTGVLATRYVRGLQGPDRRLLATLKHYVGHSASEGGRNHAPVHLGPRELADDFMLPFEMAVKLADAGSIMPAYHDIDGEPVHASRRLLTDVLRDEWGFDGIVVADYIGVSLLHKHHGISASEAESIALAVRAGLDIELPGSDCAVQLKSALDRGLITVDEIDLAVSRILREKFRLGLFEHPYTDDAAVSFRSPATLDLAREVAARSVTILDNDGTLPLATSARIAVVGPTADDPLAMLSDYSFPVHLIGHGGKEDVASVVTPLAGFEAAFGKAQVCFAQGCFVLEERGEGGAVFPGDMDDSVGLDMRSNVSTRTDLFDEAVAAANSADVVVACLGDLSGIFLTGTVGEGSDVDTLELPGVQRELLEALVNTGKPVVAVITSGRPYNLGGLESRLAAQVMAWFGGEQGGYALADVLTGAVEPTGRLPLSIPRSAGACPYFYNHKLKSSGTPIARHFGSDYPFGHGLSYTRFEYADLELDTDSVANSDAADVTLSFTVRNVGERSGSELAQLYIRDSVASVVRPVKELKGFARVALAAGDAARVAITLPVDMLGFTGLAGRRIVEPGNFEFMIGASSNDIRLRTEFEVTGEVRELPRNWRMESSALVRPM